MTFQITAVSTIEVGVAALLVAEATDELLSVVVTDPIEQVKTFLVLEFSKVPSMVFQLLFLAAD